MTPDLTPHRFPCARCGKLRRLALSDPLCWVPESADPRQPDTSCWRSAEKIRRKDQIQDAINHEGAA